jgi:Zn-dependent hydrolases, including glyoxylases
MRVTDSVFLLESARQPFLFEGREMRANVYAVLTEDGVVLIDSGFPGYAQQLLTDLVDEGLSGRPLTHILLTHADLDHIGSAADIQFATRCKVCLSPLELPALRGETARLPAKQAMWDAIPVTLPKTTCYPDAVPDGFEIVPAPGHTPGHVCIVWRDILFPGDQCIIVDGELRGPNPAWTQDMDLALRSMAALRGRKIRIVCPAHGEPLAISEFIL